MKKTDIDIDVPNQKSVTDILPHHKASMIGDGIIRPHNVGIYLQEVPTFLGSNLCSIDYQEATQFFKIDFLTNTVYEQITDNDHMDRLLNTEPDWSLLCDKKVVSDLFQISSYYDELVKWKPTSVYELAMFIAMIRPAKYHLLNCANWDEVEKDIWTKPNNGKIHFKKSHSIAYATVIKVQMNLIGGVQ